MVTDCRYMIPPARLMVQALLMLLALLFTLPAVAATATVDRDSISLDETVTLTLGVDSASIFGEPDLSKLEDDFHVMNSNRRTQLVNGDASTQWIVALSPKRAGKIGIPSFKISGERTPPIFIHVTTSKSAPTTDDTSQSLWITAEAEKPSVYVQEQAVVTVRIGSAIDLMEAPSLQKPDIAGVAFEVLNSTQYTKRINGTRYTVFEIKCAFFPDRSGALVIPPFAGQVTVPQQVQQSSPHFFQRFFNQGRRVQLKSKPIDLNVKEKPAEFPANATWLPAQSLTATEAWSDDPQNLSTGGSITRTVTLQARGSLGEQLPALPAFKLDGFKLYPDQAKTDKQIESDAVNGSRIESIAMLPTRPGDYQLPEIRIPWWNTKTDKLEYAAVPSITLKVAGAALATPSPSAPAANAAPAPVPVPDNKPAPENAAAASGQTAAGYWPWICAALAAAWILTLLMWWQSRHRSGNAVQQADPGANSKAQEKAAWDAVLAASNGDDPRRLRSALLALSAIWFADNRNTGLGALHAADGEVSHQLTLMDQQLYSQNPASERFNSSALLDALRRLRATRSQRSATGSELPPLYPAS